MNGKLRNHGRTSLNKALSPNTNKKGLRRGLCERVIRREATEIEGLVYIKYTVVVSVRLS